MSDRVYQQLRSHLAYLKLTATAEQLAPALDTAQKEGPSYTKFLHDLLAVEVDATEQRRLEGRLRFASFPSTKPLEFACLRAGIRGRVKWVMIGVSPADAAYSLVPVSPWLVWRGSLPRDTGLLP